MTLSPGKRNILFILFAFLLVGGGIFFNMPPSYEIDTTKIGKGRYALVQVFDGGLKYSYTLKEQVNSIRGEFEDEIDFYIVDDKNPWGVAFIEKYKAPKFAVMLFSPEGKILYMSTGIESAGALKGSLNKALKR